MTEKQLLLGEHFILSRVVFLIETQRDRKTERHKDRKAERQKDGKTERRRDVTTERRKDGKT